MQDEERWLRFESPERVLRAFSVEGVAAALRELDEAALAAHPQADEVILWNRHGEITEACRHNVVVDLGKGLVTPPVSCGLLAGTFRGHLLATGEVREGVVKKADLDHARRLFLVNSVRGWRAATWAGDEKP